MAARAAVPRVALIVGPVGSITASYRTLAEQAAAVAEKAGAQVVRVYSPNATWGAVKEATEGASIVVYLGHGNGFPSRYREELYPPTQNGFGLNPVAGVDDSSHQYFGEAFVDNLELAPNAVVLLHHLCYASGNTEPGLAEGTRAQAVARVDNYAAGFIRAGAKAVVAEGHLGPAYYVRALLAGHRTIEQIWRASPENHGHEFGVESVRSAGYTARLDPDRASGGYYRSLVSRGGLQAASVRASGMGTAGSVTVAAPAEPTLTDLGLTFETPTLGSLPTAGATAKLTLPLGKKELKRLPKGAQVGVRWDPILLDPVVPAGAPEAAQTDPSAPPGDVPQASSAPAAGAPAAAPDTQAAPDAEPAPAEPPAVELVVPEQLGSVVEIAKGRRADGGFTVDVTYPAAPGVYRLMPTLHTPDGVAYDAATQSLLTPVIVRVASAVSAAYGAPAGVSLETGATADLGVRVANTGAERWDAVVTAPETRLVDDEPAVTARITTLQPRLVATWVSADGRAVPVTIQVILDAAVSEPGGQAIAHLKLAAPAEPGQYLLLLDVVSPAQGPISAHGSSPGLVRVTVTEPAPVEPAPVRPPLDRRGGG